MSTHTLFFSFIGNAICLGSLYSLKFSYLGLLFFQFFCSSPAGFLAGQFFYIKYLFIFGFHGLLASFDGLEAPSPPSCPASVVLYSKMWKNFDKGRTKLASRVSFKLKSCFLFSNFDSRYKGRF